MTRHIAYIALGSNLGDRVETLNHAAAQLSSGTDGRIKLELLSSFFRTAPVGLAELDAPEFLNAAARVSTTLNPYELLDHLRSIERDLGRNRPAEPALTHTAGTAHTLSPSRPPSPSRTPSLSRTIDLDLLFYDDLVLSHPQLEIPHPRLHLRKFVLDPLLDLAPNLVHPTLGKTLSELRLLLGP